MSTDAWDRGLVAAARLPEGGTTIEPYAGKYLTDARLGGAIESVDRELSPAIERVCRRIGTRLASPPMAVCVADARSAGMEGVAGTQMRENGGRLTAVVVVTSESLVSGTVDVQSMLAHEYVHVVHADCDATPVWLREGIARWVEFERAEDAERWILGYAISFGGGRRQPISSLLADEAAMERADDYASDVAGTAFFLALERMKGADFVRKLVVRLLREREWRRVIESECGATVSGVLVDVRSAYASWAQQMDVNVVAFADAGELARNGDYPGAMKRVDGLLSSDASRVIRPFAERVRWNILWLSGDTAAALEAIRRTRAEYAHDFFIQTDSWLDELEILRKERKWASVSTVAKVLLRDFLWTPGSDAERKRVERVLVEAESSSD